MVPGWSLGVSCGWTIFAYLFGAWANQPSSDELEKLRPNAALLTRVIPDDGIRDGRLSIIWRDLSYTREDWPMPELGMYMGGENEAWAIQTSPDEPFVAVRKRRVAPEEALALPPYSVSGYTALFQVLAHPKRLSRISDLYNDPDVDRAKSVEIALRDLVMVDFVVGADTADVVAEV